MIVLGRAIAALNDRSDEMLIAVAAVTVLVETPTDQDAATKRLGWGFNKRGNHLFQDVLVS